MRSDELIASVRKAAFIRNNHPDYTDADLLNELNDSLRSLFSDLMTIPRQGYWQKQFIGTTTVNKSVYRIPHRAVVGGIEKFELADSDGTFYALDAVTENHAQFYESFAGRSGTPVYYVHRGDQLDLLPTPNAAIQYRVTYYARPSKLSTQQSFATGGFVNRGQITAIDPALRAATLNALPFDMSLAAPVAITSNLQSVDVVHPNGTFEVALVGVTQSISGLVITFGGADDVSEVQVGDYVRVSMQTDWPPLPEDFHRLLGDVTAVKVMLQLNMTAKASVLASSASGDLERLRLLVSTQRTRRNPVRIPVSMITFGSGPRRPIARYP